MGQKQRILSTMIACLVLFILGCSEKHAGGNTAEAGNPEMAGIIRLPSGEPASYARVSCVPDSFNAEQDSLSSHWIATSDSTGLFQLDSLNTGYCNLEAHHGKSGMRLLIHKLDIKENQTLRMDASLQTPGSLRLGVDSLTAGDSGTVVILGSSISRKVAVKFGSVFVDSLPASILPKILYYPKGSKSEYELGDSVQVISADTIAINASPISMELEKVINTKSTGASLSDTLFGFPYVWVLDSNQIDFSVIHPEKGRISLYLNGKGQGYSIAGWNADQKLAILWIRLDTLLPDNNTQLLRFTYLENDSTPSPWFIKPFSLQDTVATSWHFEEDSDYVEDAGPYSLEGVAHNTKSDASIVGRGHWFDGRTSYVEIPGSESGPLNFGYNDASSFSLWVRLDAPTTSRFVFSKGILQYYFKYQYPDGWLFENNDEKAQTSYHWFNAPFDSLSETGTWIHLAVITRPNAMTQMFVNGEFADSTDRSMVRTDLRFTGDPFEIGRRVTLDGEDGQYFWGVIDEFAIWQCAKSPQWIRALYKNQKGLF